MKRKVGMKGCAVVAPIIEARRMASEGRSPNGTRVSGRQNGAFSATGLPEATWGDYLAGFFSIQSGPEGPGPSSLCRVVIVARPLLEGRGLSRP